MHYFFPASNEQRTCLSRLKQHWLDPYRSQVWSATDRLFGFADGSTLTEARPMLALVPSRRSSASQSLYDDPNTDFASVMRVTKLVIQS